MYYYYEWLVSAERYAESKFHMLGSDARMTTISWCYLFIAKRLLADGNPADPSAQPLFIVGMRGGQCSMTKACIILVS